MQMRTIELDDDLYQRLEARARQLKRTPQEFIRDAVCITPPMPTFGPGPHSVLDHRPTWKSEILKPRTSRAEMLEDFFDREDAPPHTGH